jgi:dipeptide/tripeptide permease
MWKTNSSLWSREGVELFERMTTLGIAVNLVPYMTGTMHLGNAAAANTVTNFIGASFMLCLLGGFVADTYLGRYLTIAIFTAVETTVRSGCMGRPVTVRVVSHCHLLYNSRTR